MNNKYVECDSCGELDFCFYLDNYTLGQTEILCTECVHNMTEEKRQDYNE